MGDVYARIETDPSRPLCIRYMVSISHHSDRFPMPCGQHQFANTEEDARDLAAKMLETHEAWCAKTADKRTIIIEMEDVA